MNLAIMQPYFCPYIGYFQLLNAVDQFVIYDNIEYTKKGWINRNRILANGKDEYITLPLKKDSDYLHIRDRYLAEDYSKKEKNKLLNKLTSSYKKAPEYNSVFPLIERIINYSDSNLFNYILHSLKVWMEYLNITTPIIKSSELDLDITLYKGEDKVLEICKTLNTDNYTNAIGGKELYSKEQFAKQNIQLQYIKSSEVIYKQFNNDFIPWLSIIDVAMFNDNDFIKDILNKYTYE